MATTWVWLISPANGLPHRVPDNPGVVDWHVNHGYAVTDIPGDLNSDDEEFAELFDRLEDVPAEQPEETPVEAAPATDTKKKEDK